MTESIKHLAIIMDGNGRWAHARGKPRAAGHKAGLESVREVVRTCPEHGIEHLTLFAFSSENWRRPRAEVGFLMDLFVSAIKKELDELNKNGIKIRFVGDTSAFGDKLKKHIQQAEFQTANNKGMRLNIAVNYGGRWDIAQAAQSLVHAVQAGDIKEENINVDTFAEYLSLADTPDPDLLVRTSGESRISNFLIWQLAYSELYFTECLWPDFGRAELQQAMDWYSNRQRRYGRTQEQILDEVGEAGA